MKNIKKISNHIILGILFVFLLGSINSSVYGWSNNDVVGAHVDAIHQSKIHDGHAQFSDHKSEDKFGEFLIEVEEEVEEKGVEISSSVPYQIYNSIDNDILPSYFKSILNLPPPKRYLLFQHLKIYC